MAERDGIRIQKLDRNLPSPLLKSTATGPEGDVPIVLVQAEVCSESLSANSEDADTSSNVGVVAR